MRYLLDSHTLIWSQDHVEKLSATVTNILISAFNSRWISIASVWEIGIKVSLNKLILNAPFHNWLAKAYHDTGFTELPIQSKHIERMIQLPFHHRDPFDRLLAAQALVEDLPLLSCDTIFDSYGVNRIW